MYFFYKGNFFHITFCMKLHWYDFLFYNVILHVVNAVICYFTHNESCLSYLYYHSATTQGHEMPALQDSFKPALDSYYSQHDC